MKKKILLAILIGLIMCLSAEVILSEGFESSTIPDGWQMIDNDEDGYNWFVYGYDAHSGINSMASATWIAGVGPLTPDNWLITPALIIPDSTTLSWWIAIQDVNYPVEHYSVMLSNTGIAVEDFTEELFSETTDTLNYVWQQRVVDLMDWAGETVYLAWRHHESFDQFYLKIDDILVTDEDVSNGTEGLVTSAACIEQVFPNPFNPETNINFYIKEAGRIELSVYNIKGQLVDNLLDGNFKRGRYKINWNANEQASGMYFFRLISGGEVSNSKALLLK